MTTGTAETELSDISEKLLDNFYGQEPDEDGLRNDPVEMHQRLPASTALDGGQPRPDSSTSLSGFDESIDSRLKSIIDSARLEHFENGFQSEFGWQLKALIHENYQDTIIALSNFVLGNRIHPEIAAEALKSLGEIQDSNSHMFRRSLLERSLEFDSAIVRDAAIDAIGDLGDKDSIGALTSAAERENNVFVKRNIDEVILELHQD